MSKRVEDEDEDDAVVRDRTTVRVPMFAMDAAGGGALGQRVAAYDAAEFERREKVIADHRAWLSNAWREPVRFDGDAVVETAEPRTSGPIVPPGEARDAECYRRYDERLENAWRQP